MTETKKALTLKDRLSHLNYLQACRLLGQQGKDLINLGGKFEIDIDGQVEIGAESFSVKFADAKTIICAKLCSKRNYCLTKWMALVSIIYWEAYWPNRIVKSCSFQNGQQCWI